MEEEEREGGFELVGEESYLSNQNSFNELTPFSPLEPEEEITQLKWYYEERISLPSPLGEAKAPVDFNYYEENSSSDGEEFIEEEEEEETDFIYLYLSESKEPIEFVNVSRKVSSLPSLSVNVLPKGIEERADFKRSMKRYLELAKGAYAVDEDDLRERTGLTESQLLYVDFRECSGAYPRPAFYLAVDDSLRTLFLGIRGTQSKLEIQIDTQWTPIPFPLLENSFVHEGIFNAARWFIDHILSRLIQLSKIFIGYKIRVVGHSLGGGIAAVFTLLARKFLPDIKAVIFAPFACISENLLPYCAECCVSFINRSDLIPCFTKHKFTSLSFFSRSSAKKMNFVNPTPSPAHLHPIESLYNLVNYQNSIHDNNSNNNNNNNDNDNNNNNQNGNQMHGNSGELIEENAMLISQLNELKLHNKEEEERKHKNKDQNKPSSQPQNINTPRDNSNINNNIDLYPPGDLFHIFKCQMGNFYIKKITFDHFATSFNISTKLFRHHKVDSYKHAFNVIVENIYC